MPVRNAIRAALGLVHQFAPIMLIQAVAAMVGERVGTCIRENLLGHGVIGILLAILTTLLTALTICFVLLVAVLMTVELPL